MKNPLLIRADASVSMGTGHIMRMIALAQAWQDEGGEAVFLCAEITPALESRLKEEGFLLEKIHASPGSCEDLEATRAAVARYRSDSIPVALDGYQFDASFQLGLKNDGCRLLVVDDYGHAAFYHADWVLNQNISACEELYARRARHTRLLLGTKFALLRREFLKYRGWRRKIPETVRKVLITLGGADPDNVTGKVIEALAPLDIEAKVVVGGSNPHICELRQEVEQTKSQLARIQLLIDPPDIPHLMAWADLAVAAGGSTVWELLFLDLPFVTLVLANNQIAIANGCEKCGLSRNLGSFSKLSAEVISAHVRTALADKSFLERRSSSGRKYVDGAGCRRVIASLKKTLDITILSSKDSWINRYILAFKEQLESDGHNVSWIHELSEMGEGDVALFLSFGAIVPQKHLHKHANNLVVHESDLPKGRGWSPLTWQILEGKDHIPVTLFEAVSDVDAGDIYLQTTIHLKGCELVDEVRALQAETTFKLCRRFIEDFPASVAFCRKQRGQSTFYKRRGPEDSRLDPDKSIREQFNILRVCDPVKYPAFFELGGRRFKVHIAPL